ncbi:hypothetical protein M758_9G183800 [Ceratodon purpureus]|nr:hypothetical protein M758_9G183800 [Ceratodon purpureus]
MAEVEGKGGQVFVTVGTTLFDALVKEASSPECRQALADLGYTSLIIQRGKGSFIPVESDGQDGGLKVLSFGFAPNLSEYIASSALVISHAGSGSIFETLRAQRPLVVVVNDLLMDNHQCELAEELAVRKHLVYANSPATLIQTLKGMELPSLVPYTPSTPLAVVNALDKFLGFVDS